MCVCVCVRNIDFLVNNLIKNIKDQKAKNFSNSYFKKETKFYKAVQNRKCLENVYMPPSKSVNGPKKGKEKTGS